MVLDEKDVRRAETYRIRKNTAVLAVLFTDIVRSTQLLDEIGENAYERIREEHHATVTALIEANDAGAVVKSTGDGALAVFSEASTGVEGALELQRAMRTHRHFVLRIGIDVGQVSVQRKGGVVADVFGRHVTRSQRVLALADPGHILTTYPVYDCSVAWLRSPNIRWHNLGTVVLKGFREAVSVHEVFDPATTKPQPPLSVIAPAATELRDCRHA
jgi:class 3 adenylate cyclase